MSPLAWSAISDFVLAAETFFAAGMLWSKVRPIGTPSWFWALATLALGFSAFLAAIDHGFIEGHGILPDNNIVTRCGWLATGTATAALLCAIQGHFLPRQRWLLAVALVQLIVFVVMVFASETYLVVSLDAAPELLILLGFALAGLRSGRSSLALVAVPALIIIASVVQASGFDGLAPLDHNVLYHLILILAAAFYYPAGRVFAGR